MKWRKKIILAKVETTYGTDAAPTGAANAILARNIELTPLAADTVERDNPRPELGAYQKIHVGEHVKISFEVEMAGSGAAGTAPAYGPLMRACGLAETVTATTDTQYDPVSQNEESASIYMHFDGQLHKLIGARGSWGFKINKKGIPYWAFELTGMWADPASVNDPTPDFTAFKQPLHISNANTPTASLHGHNLVLSSLEVSANNSVVHRDLVGLEEVAILDRSVGGSIVFEAPNLSVWNAFTTAKANALGALQLVHGTTAGNIVQHDAPAVQIVNPTYSEEDAKVMISADLVFVPSAGDDEYKATIK